MWQIKFLNLEFLTNGCITNQNYYVKSSIAVKNFISRFLFLQNYQQNISLDYAPLLPNSKKEKKNVLLKWNTHPVAKMRHCCHTMTHARIGFTMGTDSPRWPACDGCPFCHIPRNYMPVPVIVLGITHQKERQMEKPKQTTKTHLRNFAYAGSMSIYCPPLHFVIVAKSQQSDKNLHDVRAQQCLHSLGTNF